MPGFVVVGAQWGDEGKGKLVDVFAEKSDLVVRYQGGANAGHTLVVNGKKTVLHLIPSGILHPKTQCVIAPGVVVDVFGLVNEIKMVKANGYLRDPSQLKVSDNATLLLPYHKLLDAAREKDLAEGKIGTTGKGIGPAYEDRASRRALLMADLFEPETLKAKLEFAIGEKNHLLKNMYQTEGTDPVALTQELLEIARELAPYRCDDTSLFVDKYLKENGRVIFEGAQGAMLDNFHGSYPFVTSSSTVAGSACTGTGLGPSRIKTVTGVFKAYTTRVGTGPFPTELDNEIGAKIRAEGHEFGATTGRPRRCGWLDLVALRYAIRINGMTNLALMKLDILSGHDRIGICNAYKLNGQTLTELPPSTQTLSRVEPVIEWLPGWKEDISQITEMTQLPPAAKAYIEYLKTHIDVPIEIVSVGPGREQTLWIRPFFEG
jgi:adenylosuccinate synthase